MRCRSKEEEEQEEEEEKARRQGGVGGRRRPRRSFGRERGRERAVARAARGQVVVCVGVWERGLRIAMGLRGVRGEGTENLGGA